MINTKSYSHPWRIPMNVRSLSGVMICFLLGAQAQQQDPAKEELAKLQGTWQMLSVEAGGKEMKGVKLETIAIKGNKFTGLGGASDSLTIRLDPTRKPKEIDLIREKDERKWMGIYSLEGDDLKLCMALVAKGEEQKRPTDFDNNKVQMLITASRAKP
jgi:uncharacterized protein (TIGR03067 family)